MLLHFITSCISSGIYHRPPPKLSHLHWIYWFLYNLVRSSQDLQQAEGFFFLFLSLKFTEFWAISRIISAIRVLERKSGIGATTSTLSSHPVPLQAHCPAPCFTLSLLPKEDSNRWEVPRTHNGGQYKERIKWS